MYIKLKKLINYKNCFKYKEIIKIRNYIIFKLIIFKLLVLTCDPLNKENITCESDPKKIDDVLQNLEFEIYITFTLEFKTKSLELSYSFISFFLVLYCND